MIDCRYVGELSFIGDRRFDSIGQRAVLAEAQFEEVLLGGAAFIKEDDFRKIGFTDEEIAAYGSSIGFADFPQTFGEKLSIARQVFHDTRATLRVREEEDKNSAAASVGASSGDS